MKLNRIAIGGAAGIMGLGLIGVGAHAAFVTTTQSHQQVSAGTLNVILHATTSVVASGNTSKTLTFNASSNNGSKFTDTYTVTIENKGSLAASFIHANVAASHATTANDVAFANQAHVCVIGTLPNNPSKLFTGPLSATFTEAVMGSLAPTGKATSTRTDIVAVYAGGSGPAGYGCAAATSLTNAAEGGSATVTYKLTYQA